MHTGAGGMLSSASRTHEADTEFTHVKQDLTIAPTSLWLFPSWKDAATSGRNQWHSFIVLPPLCVPCIPTLPAALEPYHSCPTL